MSSIGVEISDIERTFLEERISGIDVVTLEGRHSAGAISPVEPKETRQAACAPFSVPKGYEKVGNILYHLGEPVSIRALAMPNTRTDSLNLQFSQACLMTDEIRPTSMQDYRARLTNLDWDVAVVRLPEPSLSPSFYWLYRTLHEQGDRNYAGIAIPELLPLLSDVYREDDGEIFIEKIRALDRLIMAGHYQQTISIAYNDQIMRGASISRPDTIPLYGHDPRAWWRSE